MIIQGIPVYMQEYKDVIKKPVSYRVYYLLNNKPYLHLTCATLEEAFQEESKIHNKFSKVWIEEKFNYLAEDRSLLAKR